MKELLSAEELVGFFNQKDDSGNFILNIEEAREERTKEILNKRA